MSSSNPATTPLTLLLPKSPWSETFSDITIFEYNDTAELSHYLADEAIRESSLLFCGDVSLTSRDSLLRHELAMQENPEIVCTFVTQSSPEHLYTDETRVIDGRHLARHMIFSGGEPDILSPLLVRNSAVKRDAILPANEDVVARSALVLDLLTRGAAWIDSVATEVINVTLETFSLWRHWIQITEVAEQRMLLRGPSDWSRVAAGMTRRGATILRLPTSFESGESISAHEIIDPLTNVWRRCDALARSLTPLLDVHAVVLAWHEMEMASRPSVAAAEKIVRSASRLVVPGGDWLHDAEFRQLVNSSPVPVLVLLPGEAIDVLDDGQLRDLINGELQKTRAVITTPQGDDVRLFPPGYFTSESTETITLHSLRTVDNTTTFHDWLPQPERRSTKKSIERFIIVAPTYTERHGGSIALHRLCDRLNALGYEAYLHPIGDFTTTHPGWNTPVRDDRGLGDAVVVYPEIITGNFLSQARVVRWLLNRPGWFTGKDMDQGPNDLVVSFSHQVNHEFPIVQVPLVDPTLFFPKDLPGTGNLLWIGKGDLPLSFDRSQTTLITNDWPRSKSELASLLRSADVLYTCDWLTSIIEESVMCATPVVLVGHQTWNREEVLLRPGVTFDDELDLATAHEQVGTYYPWYLEQLRDVDAHVEQFVQLVNDHFQRVES